MLWWCLETENWRFWDWQHQNKVNQIRIHISGHKVFREQLTFWPLSYSCLTFFTSLFLWVSLKTLQIRDKYYWTHQRYQATVGGHYCPPPDPQQKTRTAAWGRAGRRNERLWCLHLKTHHPPETATWPSATASPDRTKTHTHTQILSTWQRCVFSMMTVFILT